MKYDSRLTFGNLLTMVVMLLITAGTVMAAVNHVRDESKHPSADDFASQDEIRILRQEMNDGFRLQRELSDQHFQHMTERIDGLYQ
jgi:hypothetical protein